MSLPRSQRGLAVILVLALLAIMGIFLAVNSRALYHLQQEIRLLEAKQKKNLSTGASQFLGTGATNRAEARTSPEPSGRARAPAGTTPSVQSSPP